MVFAIVVVFGSILTLLPNFMKIPDVWFLPKAKLNYGLDIQGGLHLVMGVDVHGVLSEKLARTGDTIKTELEAKSIPVVSTKTDYVGGFDQLTITFNNKETVAKGADIVSSTYTIFQEVSRTETSVTYRYVNTYLSEITKGTIEQAIETIRNRIDQFGVSEPSITAQGFDRILIQLPGLKEAAAAKDLINRTARLDLLIVSNKHQVGELAEWVKEAEEKGKYSPATLKYNEYVKRINEDLKGKLPEKTKLLFQKAENAEKMEMGKVPYLLELGSGVDGSAIKDSHVAPGDYNEPTVSLTFNPEGAKLFADITGANVGRQMAIILDDVVYSAPNLTEKIPNGSARITLGKTRDYNASLAEAKLISMALRAGALPAKLEQLEERTVGPSLGADMIAKGELAGLVGASLVFVFMILWYRTSGLIAAVAIIINILFMYAVLSALGATLTLPGIAGIALTVGMAMDANVIINERIKEELARGASFAAAVREGYSKSFSAVFDSNITTAASGVVLFYFGTGPVKGFAVMLIIGIVGTMFANVFVTHVIYDFLIVKLKLKRVSI
jgi:preprotein translocase subunit SecD